MTPPDVSVVIPTRDRPAFLRQAVSSALSQRNVEFEVIVVDDGSAVSCDASLKDVDDQRLRVLRHEMSRGVAVARNTGIEAARGRFVSFLDDDDLLAPDALAAHLGALHARREAGWSCVGMIHFDDERRIIGSSFPPDPRRLENDLTWRCAIAGPSCVVVSRAILEEVGLFDRTFSCLADWDLWTRLAPLAPLVTVARPLAGCRFHPGRMSFDQKVLESELAVFRAKHGAPATGVADLDRRRWSRADAQEHLRSGHPREALQEMWQGARRNRDAKALAYTGALLLAPGAVRAVIDTRAAWRVPKDWRRDASEWLAPTAENRLDDRGTARPAGAVPALVRRAIRRVPLLHSALYLGASVAAAVIETPRRNRREALSFYERADDPWGYETPWGQGHLAAAERLLGHATGGTRLAEALELGCGDGWGTERLADHACGVLAVDIAPGAIERARARGLGERVRFECVDVLLQPPRGKFDLVVAMGFIEPLRRPERARAARRLILSCVAPGGYVLGSSHFQHPVVEAASWAPLLPRGARGIDAFLLSTGDLTRVAAEDTGTHLLTLYRRRSDSGWR
jgi:SAM-dependent methyltransferase